MVCSGGWLMVLNERGPPTSPCAQQIEHGTSATFHRSILRDSFLIILEVRVCLPWVHHYERFDCCFFISSSEGLRDQLSNLADWRQLQSIFAIVGHLFEVKTERKSCFCAIGGYAVLVGGSVFASQVAGHPYL